MKTLLPTIEEWLHAGKRFALATVVDTWGSAPRPVGSYLLVSEDMEMAGSVSGGCVEGAVVKEAIQVLKTGQAKHLFFGVTDEDAWAVGLSCGGKIEVFVEPFPAFAEDEAEQKIWKKLYACIQTDKSCVLFTRLQEGVGAHFLYSSDGDLLGASENWLPQAREIYRTRQSGVVELGGRKWFARVFPRRNQLIIVGAAHITVELVHLAKQFDFETIVIDPRGTFVQKTQFATAPDKMLEAYPAEVLSNFTLDAYTYAAILSHDPKIDDQALDILLQSDIAYIGALGGQKTRQKRKERLLEKGYSESDFLKIHSPIGVAIQAQTPKEIALSILAELIQVKNRKRTAIKL